MPSTAPAALDAAESLYRQILDQDRLFARAWHLLGVILHQRGETATAIEYIERAIALEPQWPALYSNLGTIYSSLGRWAEAERACGKAHSSRPTARSRCALGRVLRSKSLRRAIGVFQRRSRSIRAMPKHSAAWPMPISSSAWWTKASPPTTAQRSSRPIPFIACWRPPCCRWSMTRLMTCKAGAIALTREVDALLAAGVAVDLTDRAATPVFSLAHQGMNDIEILRKVARLYRPPRTSAAVPDSRTPGLRLPRSRRLHLQLPLPHTIGKLFRGLITRLSRADFHVTVFSVGAHDDFISRELAASVDRYCLVPRDLPPARQAILDNAVDVLVYTDIGMDQTTYSLAFSRLAPVQCTTWGHPETTGIATIDYFVSSARWKRPRPTLITPSSSCACPGSRSISIARSCRRTLQPVSSLWP